MSSGGGSRERRRARRAAQRSALSVTVTHSTIGPVEVVNPSEPHLTLVDAPVAQHPALAAVAAAVDFAAGTVCADCGHTFAQHTAGGACAMDGCDCMSFADPVAASAAFQNGMPCGCGHTFSDHLGADGPCTYQDGRGQCSCKAFAEAAADAAASIEHAGFTLDEEALLYAARRAVAEERLTLTLDEFVLVAADAPSVPPEHQPGEATPPRTPGPAIVEPAQPIRGAQLAWTATLVPEGVLTDDGRAFAPGSVTWRDLPLTLMAMIETSEEGHTGAEVSGRIDRIWREANLIRAAGVFDEGDYGLNIARLVGEGTLRGVSVDIAPLEREVGPRDDYFDPDGNWIPERAAAEAEKGILDVLFGDPQDMVYVVTKGIIGAATVCPFPAFAGASIALEASLVAAASPEIWTVTQQAGFVVTETPRVGEATGVPRDGIEAPADGTEVTLDAVTASAAGLAPVAPPADWFTAPEFDELTPLTVDDDGWVSGHAWAWDTCHTGIPDACTTAPHSHADYAYFHLGEIECDDGSRVACGKITLDTGHADRSLGRVQAAAHYDHTGTVVAHVVCGEDEHGGWVTGALHSECDADKARLLRGAVLSGDWRNVNGNLELVALLAVNVPGFPVPRVKALVAAGEDGAEVMTLVAAGVHAGVTDEQRLAKVAALAAMSAPRFAELAARARAAGA